MRITALAFVPLLLASCTMPGGAPITTQDVLQHALSIVETVGDAAVRVKGYALLQKYAPEAIPLIDTNNDHVVTLAEVRAAGQMLLAQPEMVAGLLAAAYMLRKG